MTTPTHIADFAAEFFIGASGFDKEVTYPSTRGDTLHLQHQPVPQPSSIRKPTSIDQRRGARLRRMADLPESAREAQQLKPRHQC